MLFRSRCATAAVLASSLAAGTTLPPQPFAWASPVTEASPAFAFAETDGFAWLAAPALPRSAVVAAASARPEPAVSLPSAAAGKTVVLSPPAAVLPDPAPPALRAAPAGAAWAHWHYSAAGGERSADSLQALLLWHDPEALALAAYAPPPPVVTEAAAAAEAAAAVAVSAAAAAAAAAAATAAAAGTGRGRGSVTAGAAGSAAGAAA